MYYLENHFAYEKDKVRIALGVMVTAENMHTLNYTELFDLVGKVGIEKKAELKSLSREYNKALMSFAELKTDERMHVVESLSIKIMEIVASKWGYMFKGAEVIRGEHHIFVFGYPMMLLWELNNKTRNLTLKETEYVLKKLAGLFMADKSIKVVSREAFRR